jgi:DUF1680 family protein
MVQRTCAHACACKLLREWPAAGAPRYTRLNDEHARAAASRAVMHIAKHWKSAMSSPIKPPRISRRKFGVRLAAVAALGLPGADRSQAHPQQPDYVPPPRPLVAEVPPFSGPLEFTPMRVVPRVEPFPMPQVRLLPGTVFHDAQEWNRGYMARLAPERLLYTFRVNAGLPVGSATPLGGWEQPENGKRSSELRGHFVGHYLSASALVYASTGATDVKSQADSMVAELAKCQQRLGGTYLSAFPTTWWDRLEAGQRVWAPFYTIHKIMAGMFDMYRLAGNRQALQVLEGMAAWADAWTTPKTDDHMQQILGVEFGGIAETLYNLAASTGNDRWARVGDRFQKKVWYGNKWPCCSGTFPQLAADYHISTYLRSADGVYVNLFTPSRVRWSEGRATCALTQETDYPFDSKVTVKVSASTPVEMTLYVRIPAWATPGPVLSVNGTRVTAGVEPGTFAAIRRTWKEGDRIELDLPMPLRLEPVDVQHSNQQALLRGPLVLFAVAAAQPSFEKAELLRAKPAGNGSGDCMVTAVEGDVVMRPFMRIKEESYSTYVQVKA